MENTQTQKRLKAYYKKLYEQKGKKMPGSVNYIIDTMDDDTQKAMDERIADKDDFYKRMCAYARLLKKGTHTDEKYTGMVSESHTPYGSKSSDREVYGEGRMDSQIPDGPTTDEFYAPMDGISAQAEKDAGYKDNCVEKINGNTFSYGRDFPIDEYREKLAAIGNSKTGGSWYVYVDDGKLVIY